jgi:hypothetical protein
MMLPWAERVLQSLVHAGFGVDEAGSILALVSSVAISAARDASLIAETRVHPHLPEVARALRNREASEFPILSQVIAAREIETPVERDFDFDLRVNIALENTTGKTTRGFGLETTRDEICGLAHHSVRSIQIVVSPVPLAGTNRVVGNTQVNGLSRIQRADHDGRRADHAHELVPRPSKESDSGDLVRDRRRHGLGYV